MGDGFGEGVIEGRVRYAMGIIGRYFLGGGAFLYNYDPLEVRRAL